MNRQATKPVKIKVPTDIEGRVKIDTPRTAFGEQLIAELTPVVQCQFPYNINTRLVNVIEVNGGTVTQADSMAVLSTSTTTASTALMESIIPVKYNPGQGGASRFTAQFTPGVATTLQEKGIGDAVNGFFMAMNGTEFSINRRSGGSDNYVSQGDFNLDKLDGTGPSKMVIDPTKLNVFQISFQYLGAGGIEFWIEDPISRMYFLFHAIQYANANIVPSLLNATLPLRAFVDNAGTTSNMIMKIGSTAGFVQGKNAELGFTNAFGADGPSTTSTELAIFTMRCAPTFQSVANKVRLKLKLLTLSTDGSGNNAVHIFVRLNATLGGTPSFVNLDADTSVIQTDTAGTTVSGGDLILDFVMNRNISDKFFLDDLDEFLSPGDTITISSVTGVTTVITSAALTVKELF